MSILTTQYIEATRPYSQLELKDIQRKNQKELEIGPQRAYHSYCGHFYLVKRGGRKAKNIDESQNNVNIGKCSICWKLSKTPEDLQETVNRVIVTYLKRFSQEELTHFKVDLERVFHTWLYHENYD